MATKLILKAALAISILLAGSGVVVACVGLVKAGDPTPATGAEELDARQLARRGIAGDDLFGPAFVSVQIDRSDVPWQASQVEDPDNLRSF